MLRTGMQSRDKETLKETIKNLREYNQIQAKLIRQKNEKIFELNKEMHSLAHELKITKSKYNKLLKEVQFGDN